MAEPLRAKLVGGLTGCCEECEREWEPTDGLPSADFDKFVLRAKAAALVQVAHGALSLRGAAHEARMATIERRTGRRPLPGRVSRDGRMAGDWVPQYTDILASRSLPTEWPQAMSVDSFDVRVKVLDAHGKPLKKGRLLYSVFGAYGYEAGSRRGQLWHLAAFPGESEHYWREFLRQLGGAPDVVVCDGSWSVRNAAAWAFPNARIYPCAWHLQDNLRRHVEAAGLGSRRRRIWKALRNPQKDLFSYDRNWEEFERVFQRYRRADPSKADPKAVAGIVAIDKWMTRNEQAIELVLTSPHWPRDLTPLEEHLHTVQSRLGDRRRLFRNPHRLNCVCA